MKNDCLVCGDSADLILHGMALCEAHAAEHQAAERHDRAWREGWKSQSDALRWLDEARRDVATTIRLSPAAMRRADELAEQRGLSRTKLIEALILQA